MAATLWVAAEGGEKVRVSVVLVRFGDEFDDADDLPDFVEEEDARLAFLEADVLGISAVFRRQESDGGLVVESHDQVRVWREARHEALVGLEHGGDRLIAEERWVGRETDEHFGHAQAFGVPVLLEVRRRRAGRSRRLLDAHGER